MQYFQNSSRSVRPPSMERIRCNFRSGRGTSAQQQVDCCGTCHGTMKRQCWHCGFFGIQKKTLPLNTIAQCWHITSLNSLFCNELPKSSRVMPYLGQNIEETIIDWNWAAYRDLGNKQTRQTVDKHIHYKIR